MRKKLLWVAAAVALLVVVGLVALYLNLNGLVRGAVRDQTAANLKVDTKLDAARVGLFSGNVGLAGLTIGSPEGFTAPALFELKDVDVDTSYGGLFADPKRVESVDIVGPVLTLEQKGASFNLKALADKLAPPTTDEPPAGESAATKIIVGRIAVRDAKVRVVSEFLQNPIEISVPGIEVQNVGNADGAQTGEEVGRVVMQLAGALAAKAGESEQMPAELRAILAGDLSAITGKLNARAAEEIKKLSGQFGAQIGAVGAKVNEALPPELRDRLDTSKLDTEAQKKADEAAKKLTEGVGGLFGGDKKKDENEKK